MALGLELDIDFATIAAALGCFGGVQRRLDVKGEAAGVLVVDDYGHHPTEIRATLDAVRDGWPGKRLIVVFQPHRYTRTLALFDEFKIAFHRADVLVMSDIYAASEMPIEGVSSEALVRAVKRHGQREVYYLPDLESLPAELAKMVRPGDLVLTLGAGNIVRTGEALLKLLQEQTQEDAEER